MSEKIFCDGFNFERRENAPDFIVGQLSLKANLAIPLIEQHKNERGFVNIDIKLSRSGKYYAELNQWTPKRDGEGWQPRPKDEPIEVMDYIESLYWYQKEILKLYTFDFNKNAKELSRQTGIPYMSLIRTLNQTKKELKKKIRQ